MLARTVFSVVPASFFLGKTKFFFLLSLVFTGKPFKVFPSIKLLIIEVDEFGEMTGLET
jgi:hypothetical protein